jgi:hypothetical protein
MKKVIFFAFSVLFVANVAFSQSRVNQTKPQFLPEQSEILTSAIGWAYNKSIGEWIDYENVISPEKRYKTEFSSLSGTPYMRSQENQNFISMQTRMFTYENKSYYLLMVIKWVGWYKYPRIHQDWEYAEDMVGYIFSPEEYNKLNNINGLVGLRPIGGAGGGAGRKYDDNALLDSIQSILMESTVPGETGSIFPVLKSEEGDIRFCVPRYVGTQDKDPYYDSPFNFNRGYFETSPEEFSKIIINNP